MSASFEGVNNRRVKAFYIIASAIAAVFPLNFSLKLLERTHSSLFSHHYKLPVVSGKAAVKVLVKWGLR